jgi:hypothetical protein
MHALREHCDNLPFETVHAQALAQPFKNKGNSYREAMALARTAACFDCFVR